MAQFLKILSSKSLKRFPCRSDYSWGKDAKSNGARSSENGECCILPYLFLSSTPVSPSANILCHLYTLLCCTRVVHLNMNLTVSMGIILAHTQNLMALRMSFDGGTSLIFPISYHDRCAISNISNIKQLTKEHQTSKERRHELVMMFFDVFECLAPIYLFSAYQTESLGYHLFQIFFKVLRSSLLALL